MAWVRRTDGSMGVEEEKGKLDDVEFKPEKLKEDITKEFETKLTEFSTKQDEKMKPLLDMAASLAKDRTDREEAAKKAAKKKETEDNEISSEDMLLDPVGSTRRIVQESTAGTNKAIMMLAARGNIRETLQDKEYYYGDLKTKVDNMVAQQTLENQCRSDVVENCYKVIVHDHMKEIAEGKIKARTSDSTFEGGSTGGHKAESTESEGTLTADEKQAAKNFGLTEKQWIESKREMTFV